ncbi:acyltransferase family protein, partial [Veillonella nakazawae]|nr:acyltransferase family protein [Veillonella nakazawae]
MVKRIVYIDALKAFAIILVVIGHLSAMCGGGDNMIYEVIASFHMPLFLFLSGFVLKRIPTSFKLLHKCFALLLPMMTIGVILTIFIHHHSVKDMCYDSFKGGY